MQPQTQVEKKSLIAQLTAAKPGEPFNILLLGADGRKGETSYRSDTIVVAHVDPQQKKVWMLSIPRDTRVLIPGHGYQKINAAHALGGPPLTIKVVKEFTGLPIEHYMEVNFLGFENAVNELGGVWLTVDKAINDPAAASQSVHQRAAKIPAGYQKLDGEHALTFVRTRHGFADQDIGRMGNQQVFFKAVARKLERTSDPRVVIRVVNSIAPYVETDMSLMDMLKTALNMKDAGTDRVYTATIAGVWKSPYIYTDEAKKTELLNALNEGRPFVAPATAKSNTKTTTKSPALKPSSINITVKNGAGVSGYGAQAAAILKTHGFKIASVGNANQSVYPQTIVVYKKNVAAADLVAAALAPGTKTVQSKGMYSYPTEILVVTGKDWNVSDIPAASVSTQ
jgi:LCP family protein required for cell wall assembly